MFQRLAEHHSGNILHLIKSQWQPTVQNYSGYSHVRWGKVVNSHVRKGGTIQFCHLIGKSLQLWLSLRSLWPHWPILSPAQSPDQLHQIEQEAIRLSEEIKAEYWAVSAKSGGNSKRSVHAPPPAPAAFSCLFPTEIFPLSLRFPGDGIRDFFFRVASLTFEANVLSELEKSGSKNVGDIISESVSSVSLSRQQYLNTHICIWLNNHTLQLPCTLKYQVVLILHSCFT